MDLGGCDSVPNHTPETQDSSPDCKEPEEAGPPLWVVLSPQRSGHGIINHEDATGWKTMSSQIALKMNGATDM